MQRSALTAVGVGVLLMLVGVVATAWIHDQNDDLQRHIDALRAHGTAVTGFVDEVSCPWSSFVKRCTIKEVYELDGIRHSVTLVENSADHVKGRTEEPLYVNPADATDVVSGRGIPTTEAWKTFTLLGPILALGGAITVLAVVLTSRRSRHHVDPAVDFVV